MMFSNNSGGGGSGKAGVGISTVAVNTSGHLVVTLTNGTVVDAGYVEGANWQTSDGVPASTLGSDGDLCLDTSGTGNVYAKSAGEWALKTNLKGASGSGTGDMLKSDYVTGSKENTKTVDHSLLANEATKLAAAKKIALTNDITGEVSFDGSSDASITATLKTIDGVTPATYSGRLSVAVNAKGLVTGITKLPEKPTTLNIPGGSGYSSSAELCDTARKLNSVRINTRNQDYSSFTPGATTTIIVYKIVNGTTTAIATISGITVADTTYSLTTPADIEAGALVRAAFSGSNNSIPFADAICVWGVPA